MPHTVFPLLMELSRKTFDQRHFDTAYHTLMAALHLAEEQKNVLGLKEAESVAIGYLDWIDTNAPEYHHSTKSASGRGLESVFTILIRQARAKQSMVVDPLRREIDGGQSSASTSARSPHE